jgi:FtsP/CotA-like multicopper oxidase with cupredoxin domain
MVLFIEEIFTQGTALSIIKMHFSLSTVVFLPLLLHSLISSVSATYWNKTKKFDLTITWEKYAPDGFSRKMLLVNGQSPGPVLEIDQDDMVVVKVHNQSPEEITIHYHGEHLSLI